MLVAVLLVVLGASLWFWPAPQRTAQVGPELPTISAAPQITATTQVTTVAQTTATNRRASSTATSPTATTSNTSATTAFVSHPKAKPTATFPPDKSPATSSARMAQPTVSAFADPPSPGTPRPAVVAVPVTAAELSPAAATPATITVPFASSNHPNGVQMAVLPHGPTSDGAMWIPGPEEGITAWANDVSWLNTPGYATPFSTHGAVIIAGHINWQGTPGALSDLAEYGHDDIGKTLTVTMTDGRTRTYRIVQGFTIDKAQLAAEDNQGPLHTAIFGQIGRYGPAEHPTEELRLISCGGRYDPAARSYNSNIIITAQPLN